jgi:hypothetical protein
LNEKHKRFEQIFAALERSGDRDGRQGGEMAGAMTPVMPKQGTDEGLQPPPAPLTAPDRTAIDATDFGCIFDGRDNSVALQAAIDAAGRDPVRKTVQCPAGDCLLSRTITIPSGVHLAGEGSVNTRFRRTGDYGDTFRFGDESYISGGASGFTAYQDHGMGLFPPNQPEHFRNRATSGAHIRVAPDSHTVWDDLLLIGLEHQIRRVGGLLAVHRNVDCYGIFDDRDPRLQETSASILVEGDLRNIPTDVEFSDCRISGMISPKRAIHWPGGHMTTDAVEDCGARYGMQVECCEGLRWRSGYIGMCVEAGVRLLADPRSILSAFSLSDTFVDSCRMAGLLIDPSSGGTATQVSWAPSEHNAQGNGFCAVTDRPHGAVEGGPVQPSVIGLDIGGQYRTFIGHGISLATARSIKIDTNARNWNCRGFYDGSPGLDAFVWLGRDVRSAVIYGLYGGGPQGDGASNHDGVAVRYDMSPGSRSAVTILAASATGTRLAGDLG